MDTTIELENDDASLLDRITARFLPEDFATDNIHELFRARVVVALSFTVSIFGPIYAVLVRVMSGDPSQMIATLVATVGVAATPFLLRRGWSFTLLGNWMTFCGAALFVFVASRNLGPSVLIWQVVFLVLLAFIAGRRSVLAWLVVSAGLVAYFYGTRITATETAEIAVTDTQLAWEMSIIIGMFVAVLVLTLLYDAIKNWALDEIRRKGAHTRAILEAAPDGIVTLTNDGRVGKFNAAAEALFDYTRDDVRQAPFTSLVPEIDDGPTTPAEAEADDEEPIADGRLFAAPEATGPADAQGLERWTDRTWEATAVRRDGSKFPAELSVTPIEDEDDRFVAILRDITERKKTQQALRQARDRAVEANEAKSRFLANMSHELRTPLNAIIGYSELVAEDLETLDEPRLVEDVTKIEDAGNHLLSLINEILDLSKVEAGQMQILVEEVETEQLVDRVTSTIRPLIEDNDNRLKVDVEDAPETMRVDRKKLRQILINLLSNAAKFTEDGLIRVHAFTERRDGIDYGIFEVIDRGIGIPEDKLDELFEAFSQADESTTRDFGGTGLGLTICQEFVDLMAGDIEAESQVGEGSTFRVKLPVDVEQARQQISSEDSEPDRSDEPEVDPSGGDALPDDAPEVAVVDDDPTVHRLMKRFLDGKGFRVTPCTGGPSTLQTLREVDPDIITLDVLMPEIDGWGILDQIKNDDQLADIPVVMLTIVEDRNLAFSLGATDYLTKPIETDRLVEVLEANLDQPADRPVLIAEDEQPIRDIIRRTIEDAGFDTVCAADGREAMNYLEDGRSRPAAILLDLMMPRLDGFEVLERLRKDPEHSDIPVIVVSAAELTEAERRMLEQNTSQLLEKGEDVRQRLVAELEAAIEDDEAKSRRPEPTETSG